MIYLWIAKRYPFLDNHHNVEVNLHFLKRRLGTEYMKKLMKEYQ